MAVYKEKNYLGQNDDSAFDRDYSIGDQAPLAGIYRCMVAIGRSASLEARPCRGRTTTRIHHCRELFVGG